MNKISSLMLMLLQTIWIFKYEREELPEAGTVTKLSGDLPKLSGSKRPREEKDSQASSACSGRLGISQAFSIADDADKAMAALMAITVAAKSQMLQSVQQAIHDDSHGPIRSSSSKGSSRPMPSRPTRICEIFEQGASGMFCTQMSYCRFLGEGSTSEAWEVDLHGFPAVMKQPCDKDMQDPEAHAETLARFRHEVAILTRRLRHLQGTAVPEVLAVGHAPGGTLPRIAVEDLVPLTQGVQLSQGEAQEAEALLGSIHSAGVLHGDVRPSMIFRTPQLKESNNVAGLRVSDFSHSRLDPDSAEKQQEAREFSKLLASLQNRPESGMHEDSW